MSDPDLLSEHLDDPPGEFEQRLELVAAVIRDAIEAAQASTVEAVRSELRTIVEQAVEGTITGVRAELATLRAAMGEAAEEDHERDANEQAMLRTEVRRVLDRAARETFAPLRDDIAVLRAALRTAADDGQTGSAAVLGALRDDVRTTVEAVLRAPLDDLRADVATARFSLEALAQANAATTEALAGLRDVREAEALALREAVGQALLDAAAAHESALATTREDLHASLSALEERLSASANASRARDEAESKAREELQASLDGLEARLTATAVEAAGTARTQAAELRTMVERRLAKLADDHGGHALALRRAVDRALSDDAAAREAAQTQVLDDLHDSLLALDERLSTRVLAVTSQASTRADELQSVLETGLAAVQAGLQAPAHDRDEWIETLRFELRAEAAARAAVFEAAQHRVEELANTTSALVRHQLELSERLFGRP